MDIHRVSQYQKSDDCIIIQFSIGRYPYYLVARRDGAGAFFPFSIRHDSHERCSYCQKRNLNACGCNGLYGEKETIFDQLIQYPSVRLEWLYLPHIEKGVGK